MMKKLSAVCLIVCALALPAVSSAGLPGTTQTVFNRRFAYKLRARMSYDQLAALAGSQGQKIREDRKTSSAIYHWNGGRRSTLDVTVAAGKVVDLLVTSPKKTRFALGRNGEVVER